MKKISEMTLDEIRAWRPKKLTDDDIREIVDTIVAVADPEKVILFGSYARGDATAESDLDLLVVKETGDLSPHRSAPLYHALGDYLQSVDVLVYTPRELETSSSIHGGLASAAVSEGMPLYVRA